MSTELTIARGDSWSEVISDLSILTSYSNIWFTLKKWISDTDADALIQIDYLTGLLTVNGVAFGTGSASQGSITITDFGTGSVAGADITLALEADITEELEPGTYIWDLQLLEVDDTVHTLDTGKLEVTQDVTLTR